MKTKFYLGSLVFILALTACGGESVTPTTSPASTTQSTSVAAPMATDTPVPTATATPAPMATATSVPTATATSVPTATATSVPTATATPAPMATATSVPTATPTPRIPPSSVRGTAEWWEYVAPYSDFIDNTDTERSSKDVNVYLMYGVAFTTDSWLHSVQPWTLDFGEFVDSLPFSDFPFIAIGLTNDLLEVDESLEWAQPYLFPASADDFVFASYLLWAACLSDRSWEDCETEIGSAIAGYMETFG
jgi:hypothetical protein